MRRATRAAALAAVALLIPLLETAPATAEPTRAARPPARQHSAPESLTSDDALRAAGYERMAVIRLSGATGTLWRIIEPAGAWTWHGNLHNAPPGSRIEARNWFENVITSAVVAPGHIGVNTSTWSSRGRFRICIYVAGGRSGCSYFSPT
ncbi:hypothetical protein HUT18_27590 [Streptomyces sp. NA04227]|uniref:hypothetical protein n=1 Tax=Streptomyces sp. NA04227 TaxID=2742136 RepID=UPI00159066A0|nr:hypothetical protein [Streptomyces sp. NA04227]QKW09599.1 hypothetical protein HUT18_27590 [Streptomyces sp. NA04227]